MGDLNNIAALIGTLGFPIVACCAMGYFFVKIINNYRADIKELQGNHKAEIDKLSEVVSNNTLVLQKLVDRLDDVERETDD